jgi:hypothetical protein
MLRPTTPHIDPLAHRATIDALEAQRAAYRRFARTVEAQQHTFDDGDADRALAATTVAVHGFEELQRGAARLTPLVGEASAGASADQLLELQREMDELMREAHLAEAAIHNMTAQLEAWRDAYGRQLAELGLAPGGEAGAGAGEMDAARGRYGPRGGSAPAPTERAPSLIDRKG